MPNNLIYATSQQRPDALSRHEQLNDPPTHFGAGILKSESLELRTASSTNIKTHYDISLILFSQQMYLDEYLFIRNLFSSKERERERGIKKEKRALSEEIKKMALLLVDFGGLF